MMARSPGRMKGARHVRTKRRKTGPLTAPRCVSSRDAFPTRMAPMMDTVSHERWGRVPCTRCPRGHQRFAHTAGEEQAPMPSSWMIHLFWPALADAGRT